MAVDGTICAIAIYAARMCPKCDRWGTLTAARPRDCDRCFGSTPDSPVVRIMLASRADAQRPATRHSLLVRSPGSARLEDWQDLIGRELWGDTVLTLGRDTTWARRIVADEIELVGSIVPIVQKKRKI